MNIIWFNKQTIKTHFIIEEVKKKISLLRKNYDQHGNNFKKPGLSWGQNRNYRKINSGTLLMSEVYLNSGGGLTLRSKCHTGKQWRVEKAGDWNIYTVNESQSKTSLYWTFFVSLNTFKEKRATVVLRMSEDPSKGVIDYVNPDHNKH